MHPLRKLLNYAAAYRSDFQKATLYSVLNKFFDILPEVLIGAAVDVVVKGEQSFLARNVLGGLGITSTWEQLLALGAFNVVVWGGESLFQYLYEVQWRQLAQNLQHDLRLDTYRHVQRLDMAYFENQRTGNLMAILNDDINQMERFLNGGANQIIQVLCSSVLVFLTQRLLWPMTSLADVAEMYQRSMAAIERAMGLLDTPTSIPYEGQHFTKASVRGEVRLEDVGFSYATTCDTPTLHGINLTIAAGQTTAFVGSTGSGKSTLVKLLLRFYEPQHGRILLDGAPIDSLNLQDLRRAIGYVAQDAFLSDATVAENIAYGSLDAVSDAAIAAAAEAAGATEFIAKLPLGFATRLGERGQKLSGGQRQRLALARAILKDPPILILDEATSAVDNETEAAIQRSLDVVSRNRTTIVIAHRLSTVRQAHCIHVVEAGRIVESGDHEALFALGGSYAALWRLQTGERAGA